MARSRISKELSLALAISLGLHAVWLVREAKASSAKVSEISEVSLETIAPPPKVAETKPEEPPAPTNAPPEPVQRMQATHPSRASSQSAPSAAQAAKTLTAPDAAGASDLADFTMVQGEGTSYAGGTTSAIGNSRSAVQGPVSDVAAALPRAAVTSARESSVDRSRSATPAVPAWDCSRLFPSDADAGDYATVLIAVSVGSDGSAKRVAMLRDPGHGFGAAAIQCAMSQRFQAALDRTGNPVAATTPPILVRFSR
jgi:hypothetical protein